MGSRRIAGVSTEALSAQAAGLGEAVATGGQQLDPQASARARAVVDKVAERVSIAGSHTVVALAGATGSGKSSLFNALVGADVAEVGPRRPTTSVPTAAVWGEEPATELLDWLSVTARHHVRVPPSHEAADRREPPAALDGPGGADGADGPGGPGGADGLDGLDGLVLLDLPDFDSRELTHRAEAERILGLCDVFVWVTDPQKYADALLHDEYVQQFAGHAAVTMVVLNQSDRLTPQALEQCRADLVSLLLADGVPGALVLTTSACTGVGVGELRQRIRNVVVGQGAARQRLSADVTAAALVLRAGVADAEPAVGTEAGDRLVAALSRAAGVPVVLTAVEKDYRREANGRSGWLFTRWARAFRPDPLRRLRLGTPGASAAGVLDKDVRAVLGRSSIPAPSPAARSAVTLATRDLADGAGAGLPLRWSEAVAAAASPETADLADALDRAVLRTPLRARNPVWWRVMGLLQWVTGAAALAGLGWLVVLGVIGWLQLPQIDTPRWGPLPYPFLLLAGGLVVGILGAWLSRVIGRVGARRRRALVARRLTDSIGGVAEERIVTPVREVLDRHRTSRERLEAALNSPGR